MNLLRLTFATFFLMLGANANADVKGVNLECTHSYPSENPRQDNAFRYKYPLSFKVRTDNKNDLYTKDSEGRDQAAYLNYDLQIPIWNQLGYNVNIIAQKATPNGSGYSIIEIRKGSTSSAAYNESDSLTAETRLSDENGQRNIQCRIVWVE